MAEAQTQPEDLPAAVDGMEVKTARMAGHNVKRMSVATSEDGGPKTTMRTPSLKVKLMEGSSEDPMGQTARTEQHQNIDLLQQMTTLCQTVQNLGKQMPEGFAAETKRQEDFETESQKRQDDYNKMEKKMTAKLVDGFKGEEMARQQAQDEVKQRAKKDLDAIKEEMNSLQKKNGSTEHWSGSGRLRHLCQASSSSSTLSVQ